MDHQKPTATVSRPPPEDDEVPPSGQPIVFEEEDHEDWEHETSDIDLEWQPNHLQSGYEETEGSRATKILKVSAQVLSHLKLPLERRDQSA